jgi:hypothetical protein
MSLLKVALILVLLPGSHYTYAQTKKPPVKKKVANTTKLDLVYKGFTSTSYSPGTGASRSSFFDLAYLRVNDGKPERVDRHADLLRRYYTKAPLSNQQIDLMITEKRKGTAILLIGGIGGTAYGMSGVFANTDMDKSKFYTRALIGSAVFLGAAYLKTVYDRRADRHLRRSVDIYNQKYYKPLITDSTDSIAKNNDTTAIVHTSGKKYYEEKAYYNLIRNDPGNSGLWGASITYASLDFSMLNINMTGGLGLFYTYKSLVGISADYQIGYFDLVTGSNKNKKPDRIDRDSYGIPVDYKKPSLLDIQAKVSVFSWEKEGNYHVYLGRERIGRMGSVTKLGRVRGLIRKAITARAGFMLDNRVVQNINGISLETTTPPYVFMDNGKEYTMTPRYLSTSAAMLETGIISAGIGLTTFMDLKIQMADEEYKGRKEEKSQTDIFVDVLYAQSQKLQDITYYHISYETDEIIPQRLDISGSPLSKAGFRAGVSFKKLSQFFGTKYGVELGMRPGPKVNERAGSFYCRLSFGVAFGGRTKSYK